MIRAIGLCFFLILAGAQDPADKVRSLVAKLDSEEIAERDKAAGELFKLGSRALPALRDHEAKSAGAVKAALQSIIKRIESADRLLTLLGTAPVVTLSVKDAEVEKVVAEMARQTGLDITGFFLDSSMKVTLACDKTPVWKAVDDLCRAQGAAGYRYSARSIVIEGNLELGTPVTIHRGLGIHFKPARRLSDGKLSLQGVVTYAPGAPVWHCWLEFDELTDDAGTSLAVREAQDGLSLEMLFANHGMAYQFASKLTHRSASSLDEKATKLGRVRGAAVAQVAVAYKPIFKVPAFLKETETTVEEAGYKMTLKPRRTDDKLIVSIKVLAKPEGNEDEFEPFTKDSKRTFGYRDDKGQLYLARSLVPGFDFGDNEMLKVEAALAKGREVVSFEYLEVEEFTEVRVPFDYANVPLK